MALRPNPVATPVVIIALSQLFGTSLWFSVNSAAGDLGWEWDITPEDIGWLTTAVQAGFILGTLTLSVSGLADRIRASTLFATCAVAGALFNAGFALLAHGVADGIVYRFLVGLALAGIYPIGMKLIVSWEPQRTGSALALLVGMLTLGTALPHALRAVGAGLPWQQIILASSALAVVAAVLVRRLGDGPHLRPVPTESPAPDASPARPSRFAAFRIPAFRASAFGYFGHMWELYAFWTLVPMLVADTLINRADGLGERSGPALSFAVIAAGAAGCLAGGWLSRRLGSAAVAALALTVSGGCIALFGLGWRGLPPEALLGLLLIWGATVVADSPQFSALSARACPPQLVGGALSIQNSLGFALTVVSISLTSRLYSLLGPDAVWILLPGPALGLLAFWPRFRSRTDKG